MAKISNEDYLRDAIVIRDKLLSISDLNKSSVSLLKQMDTFVEENDGRYAFVFAGRAEYMHVFCNIAPWSNWQDA